MKRAYYTSTIANLLKESPEAVLSELLMNDEQKTDEKQKLAWRNEIEILQDQLSAFRSGEIALAYAVPRMGYRIDAVCLICGVIFLLEFRVGERMHKKLADDQVMDYALDLKYFHEASRERIIVPIHVATEARTPLQLQLMADDIASVMHCGRHSIKEAILSVLAQTEAGPLTMRTWTASRYAPTPTIIEAAQAMYRRHSVSDISRNDAGAQNLSETTASIRRIIEHCKTEHKKAICFVTGVPGAGKTLAGLNIANEEHRYEEEEHAVFLSGNAALVDVLQEALARDRAKHEGISAAAAKRETRAFIQIIHKFRDEALMSTLPPLEKVVIFDEAQRAWNEAALSAFMTRKKGAPAFHQSEPEFLISVMDRHPDWAAIICLVGGGQEIFTGEAGMEEWFRTLREKFRSWEIFLSDRMKDYEYVGRYSAEQLLSGRSYYVEPSLHLSVSLRSFRSEKVSAFVKALLDNDPQQAREIYASLHKDYPIYMTRDINVAKRWVRQKARGTERYGILGSSEGKRIRAEGLWIPSSINHVGWFLNGKENVDSSYYMEVVASEFEVQGLEIDYSIVAWDADMRRENGTFAYYRFRGTGWNRILNEMKQRYMKNAYRVLLTRARQGMVLYVPKGSRPEEDPSRNSVWYDAMAGYLADCGIEEI